jgi:hypothetical protein
MFPPAFSRWEPIIATSNPSARQRRRLSSRKSPSNRGYHQLSEGGSRCQWFRLSSFTLTEWILYELCFFGLIMWDLKVLVANYDGWIKRSPYGRVRVNIK